MNTCPNCGAEIRPGDNFCLNCGHRIATAPPSPSAPQNDATLLGGATAYNFSDADDKTLAAPYPGTPAPFAQPASKPVEHPAHLIITLNNTDNTQQYFLEKTETTIGRAPNNDLVLTEDKDKLISRYHATLRYENGNYILRDSGSANGTILNGQELEKKVDQSLRDGDKIAIGDYTLIFYAPTSLADEHTMIGYISDQSYATVPSADAPQEAGEPLRTMVRQNNSDIPPVPPPSPVATATSNVAPNYTAEAIPPVQSPPPSPSQTNAKPPTTGISIHRFTQFAQPLPDFAPLSDATTTLNGQIAALQQQIKAAQAATQGYQQELGETTNQFRAEMQRVIDRINEAATAMNASRDEIGMDRLIDLVQDVIHNPRDIDNARAFADRASSVNKLIQRYETALKTLQECGGQLYALIGKEE